MTQATKRSLKFLVLGLALWQSACSKTVIIRSKERVGMPLGAPVMQDNFVQGRAKGLVDLVFVVDQSRYGEAYFPEFRQYYRQFLAELRNQPDFGDVRYRVQVVSSPGYRSPEFFYGRDSADELRHLGGIFDNDRARLRAGVLGQEPILSTLSRRQDAVIDPFRSVQVVLGEKAFADRLTSNLFIIFVTAQDLVPSEHQAALESLVGTIGTRGQTTKVHPWILYGGRAPVQLPSMLGQLSWRAPVELAVDDRGWPARLVEQVVTEQKALVLSYVPVEPQSMRLSAGDRSYVYGTDYVVNPKSNALEWLRPSGLEDSALLSAVYYFNNGIGVNGGPNPGRPPINGEK